MRTMQWMLGAAAGCLMLAWAAGAPAQDWPQWRGANRDGKTAFQAPAAWPKEMKAQWKVTVGTGDATPALVDGKLYVFARQGAEEVTLCLSAADGKEIWRDHYAAPEVKGPAGRHGGPRSSPAVAGGKVVTLGVDGTLSCLDAASGKVAWRKDEIKGAPMFFTAMSPIIVDGMAIAHLGGKGKGTVAAYDLASGAAKWQWEGDGPTYDSPVAMTVDETRMIVLHTEKKLIGLGAADGKLLWQVESPTQQRFYNSATPVVEGAVVITTGQGKGTRALKIERADAGFAAKEIWKNEQLGAGFCTPVLKGEMLYGLSDKGNLYCMSARDGKTVWSDSAKHNGNFGAMVDAGAVVLALPSDSTLIAFKPGARQYEEVAQMRVAETPTYAYPVVAGKRIFVKDQDALAMFVVE
jgi:outer membrane protein assembly factor BamB